MSEFKEKNESIASSMIILYSDLNHIALYWEVFVSNL